MLSIFKNGPTKATRTLGVWFNLNCEVGSFGHGHLSARTLRRLGQGYHHSLLAWDEKRPRWRSRRGRPPRPEAIGGLYAEARGGGKVIPAESRAPSRLRRGACHGILISFVGCSTDLAPPLKGGAFS